MSFPVHIYGNYGDERTAQSTKIGGLPLGTRMILPDGRVFVHAKASSAASIAVGVMCIEAATSSSAHVANLTCAAGAGSAGINITLTATGAVTKDQFEDGYVFINDSGAASGQGYVYKIKGNNSGAVSTTVLFTLYETDSIQVVCAAASTEAGLRVNEFNNVVIQATGTAQVGIPVGVTSVAASAGFYCWLQRRGPACVLDSGTAAVAGERVAAQSVVAGGIQRYVHAADTTTVGDRVIGWCMAPSGASTDYDLVYLTLD